MSSNEQQRRDEASLRRLQTGAAIVLGLLLLAVIVLRAYAGNALPAGWWRP